MTDLLDEILKLDAKGKRAFERSDLSYEPCKQVNLYLTSAPKLARALKTAIEALERIREINAVSGRLARVAEIQSLREVGVALAEIKKELGDE